MGMRKAWQNLSPVQFGKAFFRAINPHFSPPIGTLGP